MFTLCYNSFHSFYFIFIFVVALLLLLELKQWVILNLGCDETFVDCFVSYSPLSIIKQETYFLSILYIIIYMKLCCIVQQTDSMYVYLCIYNCLWGGGSEVKLCIFSLSIRQRSNSFSIMTRKSCSSSDTFSRDSADRVRDTCTLTFIYESKKMVHKKCAAFRSSDVL